MKLSLKARGVDITDETHQDVEAYAHLLLNRLARRVSAAQVTLSMAERATGRFVHVCSLRLQLPGVKDVVVKCLRPGRDAAIAGALRGARRAVLERLRASRKAAVLPALGGSALA